MKGKSRALDLVIFQPVGLDHPGTGEAFLQEAGDFAHLGLRFAGCLSEHIADADDRQGSQRIDDKDEQGEHPVEDKHGDDGAQNGQRIPQQIVGGPHQ